MSSKTFATILYYRNTAHRLKEVAGPFDTDVVFSCPLKWSVMYRQGNTATQTKTRVQRSTRSLRPLRDQTGPFRVPSVRSTLYRPNRVLHQRSFARTREGSRKRRRSIAASDDCTFKSVFAQRPRLFVSPSSRRQQWTVCSRGYRGLRRRTGHSGLDIYKLLKESN